MTFWSLTVEIIAGVLVCAVVLFVMVRAGR
jgi:hypothetical protein